MGGSVGFGEPEAAEPAEKDNQMGHKTIVLRRLIWN